MGLLGTLIGGSLGFRAGRAPGSHHRRGHRFQFRSEGGPQVHPGARVNGQYYGRSRTGGPQVQPPRGPADLHDRHDQPGGQGGQGRRLGYPGRGQVLRPVPARISWAWRPRNGASPPGSSTRPATRTSRPRISPGRSASCMGHQPARLRDLISLLMSIAMADGRYP